MHDFHFSGTYVPLFRLFSLGLMDFQEINVYFQAILSLAGHFQFILSRLLQELFSHPGVYINIFYPSLLLGTSLMKKCYVSVLISVVKLSLNQI